MGGGEEERHNLCLPGKLKKGIKLIYNAKGTGNKDVNDKNSG